MNRDELISYVVSEDSVLHINEILAEYDRLTAINAQLLEALKATINPQKTMTISQIEALIRAAETTSPPPPGVHIDDQGGEGATHGG